MNVEVDSHARLAPSNHRWPHCPGSVREEAKYPDIAGDAAIDGTGTHLLLELCILNNRTAESYIGEIIGVNHHDKPNGWEVDEERAKRAKLALDYIYSRKKELAAKFPFCDVHLLAESKSDPGAHFGRNDWYGTADVTLIAVHKNSNDVVKYIEIIDLKDGQMWVDVRNNSQFESYMFGKLAERPNMVKNLLHDILVQATVIQPKSTPPIRTVIYDGQDLFVAAIKLNEAAQRTDDPDAPLIPDDKGGKGHCRWCKHRENCPALAAKNTEVLTTMTESTEMSHTLLGQIAIDSQNISDLPDERLVQIADAEPGVMSVFDRVKAEIQSRLENGNEIDGYEMLPGRATKVWNKPDEEIEKMLKGKGLKKDDIYPPTLISPAKALSHDKLSKTKRERVAEFVSEKAGNLKLTRVERKGNSGKTAADMFGPATATEVKPTETVAESKPNFW